MEQNRSMTMIYNLTAMIVRDGDSFHARCLELSMTRRARTVDRARAKLRETAQAWLEAASESEVRERLASREVYIEAILVTVPDATEQAAGGRITITYDGGQV